MRHSWHMHLGHLFAPIVAFGKGRWQCRGCGMVIAEFGLLPTWRCCE